MAVEVGSAVGYLDLDISGFLAGLKQANEEAGGAAQKMEKTLSEKFKSAGEKISSVGGTLTKTVTLPITGLGTASITTIANFESAMSKVSAISGATGKDLEALTEKAEEMGSKTKFSASESAEAFQYMAMAGWKTQDMIEGIDGIMALAAADGLDLATTSDIVTDALTAFGMSASDSAHFADVLAKASSSANTNVSMLGESFKYVAPVAGSLGYSAEDTAIALGLMANSGIKASQGGTALRASLSRLINPTDEAANLMGKYGIEMTNADGSMKSLSEVMGMLRNNLGELTEAEQANVASTIFGQEAMSGMLAIINASESDYNNLTEAIYNCDGAAQQMADVQLDNLSGQITILKSTLEGLAIQFGEIILPYVKDFVTWLQNLAQKFSELSPQQKEAIVKFAAFAAVIGPLLLILGKMTTGIGSVISVFSKLGSAAQSTTVPVKGSSEALGGMAKTALSMIGAGAGILLAASGLALLAQSSIALADAGWPAIAVMGGLVVALAGLAVGASVIAPALTAGAVGLVAFGGAVALVGVGVLAATGGIALLATQLPVISEYGASAAINIALLGGALVSFGGGALTAGGGAAVLGAGLLAVGVGATTAAAGVTLLGAGTLVLAAGAITLGAGLVVCGAGLTLIASSANTAAEGMSNMAVASATAFVPIIAGAGSCAALTLAVGAMTASVGLATIGLTAAAGACALLLAAVAATASSVGSIEKSAGKAAKSLEDMVTSVDVAGAGIKALGKTVDSTMSAFVKTFTDSGNKASKEASSMSKDVSKNIDSGMKDIPSNTSKVMDKMVSAVDKGMTGVNKSIKSGFNDATSYIKGLKGQASGWGADVIQGIANGIRAKIPTLKAAVRAAANVIYSNLHFSVPDEGPLTEYETWMPDFMKGLAKGINDNSYRVKSAMQSVAEDMVIDVKPTDVKAFSTDDTDNLKAYNITLVDTVALYKQLIEQMKMYTAFSGIVSGDNNLIKTVTSKAETAKPRPEEKEEKPDEKSKPDVLNIPISIGEEQLETVVVDLLRREVRT